MGKGIAKSVQRIDSLGYLDPDDCAEAGASACSVDPVVLQIAPRVDQYAIHDTGAGLPFTLQDDNDTPAARPPSIHGLRVRGRATVFFDEVSAPAKSWLASLRAILRTFRHPPGAPQGSRVEQCAPGAHHARLLSGAPGPR